TENPHDSGPGRWRRAQLSPRFRRRAEAAALAGREGPLVGCVGRAHRPAADARRICRLHLSAAAVSRSQPRSAAVSRSQQGDDINPKHSGMGLASFTFSLVVGFAIFAAVIINGKMETSASGVLGENSPEAMLLGLVLIAPLFADVVALGL